MTTAPRSWRSSAIVLLSMLVVAAICSGASANGNDVPLATHSAPATASRPGSSQRLDMGLKDVARARSRSLSGRPGALPLAATFPTLSPGVLTIASSLAPADVGTATSAVSRRPPNRGPPRH